MKKSIVITMLSLFAAIFHFTAYAGADIPK
jgi:hypothetical protein